MGAIGVITKTGEKIPKPCPFDATANKVSAKMAEEYERNWILEQEALGNKLIY